MKNKNYKLFILMSFLLLTGCNKPEHKNVVTGKGTIEEKPMLLLEDVDDGTERILYINSWDIDYYNNTDLDDTVTLRSSWISKVSDKNYASHFVFYPGDIKCVYNNDSIYARKQREKFNKSKQQITPSQKTR